MIKIAIDGNEANISNRVGSNVYAFELLRSLEKLTHSNQNIDFTVLLRQQPITDLPKARLRWNYRVVGPSRLWTQWALPLHLFAYRHQYDLLFSPGHYAPHTCPVPYVSSIMDTAYLDFPDHFRKTDLFQLTFWTKRAVKNAAKIVAISEATKADIVRHYHKKPQDIVVIYPAHTVKRIIFTEAEKSKFFKQNRISEPYILFVGTIQPRKNLTTLVEAFEIFTRMAASRALKTSRRTSTKTCSVAPKLVLAGKTGWMADSTLERIDASPLKQRIILTGFVTEAQKQMLYKNALASVLIGTHEGFGIPPLESLAHRTIPVVSNTTSLPEVVGDAGLQVDPTNAQAVADALWQVYTLTARERALYRRKAADQVKRFSWDKSARIVLNTLESVAADHK